MYRAKDIVGQVFGRLTVLSRAGKVGTWASWNCRCVCGNETVTYGTLLRQGRTKSCGCLSADQSRARFTGTGGVGSRAKGTNTRRQRFAARMVGKVFGRLTVVALSDAMVAGEAGKTEFLCRCECGKSKVVRGYLLRIKRVKSCGCARDLASGERMRAWNAARPPRVAGPRKPRPPRHRVDRPKLPALEALKEYARARPKRDPQGRLVKSPCHFPMVNTKEHRRGGGKKQSGFLEDAGELQRLLRSVTAEHATAGIEGPEYWGPEDGCPWSANIDPEEAV